MIAFVAASLFEIIHTAKRAGKLKLMFIVLITHQRRQFLPSVQNALGDHPRGKARNPSQEFRIKA